MNFPCAFNKDRFGLGSSFANDDWCVFFDDTGFLSGNLCQCITEKLYVVKTDVGNETEVGMNNIGAVQASAQSHFNNSYIYLLGSKIMESHSGGKFKERGVERLEEGTVLFNKINYKLLRNRSSIDADSFAKVDEVRRSIESCFISCRL